MTPFERNGLGSLVWRESPKVNPRSVITCCRVCGNEYLHELVCPGCIGKQRDYMDRKARQAQYYEGLAKAGKKYEKEKQIKSFIEEERKREQGK